MPIIFIAICRFPFLPKYIYVCEGSAKQAPFGNFEQSYSVRFHLSSTRSEELLNIGCSELATIYGSGRDGCLFLVLVLSLIAYDLFDFQREFLGSISFDTRTCNKSASNVNEAMSVR